MKPAWDKLMKEYKGKEGALVADVDCTADGKSLCDREGVKGFPTIKWGDPKNLEDYQGGRDFKDLKKFADENLKPICGPENMDVCDEEQKKELEELLAMSEEDLQAKVDEGEKKIKDAEETFQTKLEELQNTYQEIMKTKDDTIAEVKSSGLGMYKSVAAFKKKSAGDADDKEKEEL